MLDPLQPQQQSQQQPQVEGAPPSTPWQHRPPAAPPRRRRRHRPPRTVWVVIVGTVGLVLFVLNRHLMMNYDTALSSTTTWDRDFQPQSPREIEEEQDNDETEEELRRPDRKPLPQDDGEVSEDDVDQVRQGAHHQQHDLAQV